MFSDLGSIQAVRFWRRDSLFCEKATAIATEHPTDGFAFLGKSESVHNDKKSNTEWCWTFCGVFELNVH